MKLYVTRHGQVCPNDFTKSVDFPTGDIPLSEKGQAQAACLGEELKPEYDGAFAIIDGFSGKIYIDPDEETLELMKKKQAEDREKKALLQELKGKEKITEE